MKTYYGLCTIYSDIGLLNLNIEEIELDETKLIPYGDKFKTGLRNTNTHIPNTFVYFETKQEAYDNLIIMLRDVAAKYIKRIVDIQSSPGYLPKPLMIECTRLPITKKI